ncbi:MAG: HAMP domain-containing sensor histidine kinase [Coriobacteriia bacterium]
MARIRRPTVSLWQTGLFVVVIVVAILVLSVSLSGSLKETLGDLAEKDQYSDASALASQLSVEYPLTVESLERIRHLIDAFQTIYEDSVWLYDVDGTLRISEAAGPVPPEDVLQEAFLAGLADAEPFTRAVLASDGYVVAAKAVYDRDGRRAAVVVTSSPVTTLMAVLDAVRSRLWTTFWISLIVAGGIGYGFSEIIGRRVRMMSQAAAAIAAGDFNQRVPTSLVPSEVYELAESYNRMAVTLGEVFESQREFVANASHELRTPISAAKGLLELLLDGAEEDPEVRHEFLETMAHEIDRLGRLVADLLTLAELEAGGFEMLREPVDVSEMLENIRTVMCQLAEQSGVELALELPDGRLHVDGDRDRITQVLIGFVDNAIKHTPKGMKVTIGATPEDDSAWLWVHNDGEGIDPEIVPRLFERFYRADDARSPVKGTGLGLSIAKEIIEAHGSEVVVESPPEGGVTFGFMLPKAG